MQAYTWGQVLDEVVQKHLHARAPSAHLGSSASPTPCHGWCQRAPPFGLRFRSVGPRTRWRREERRRQKVVQCAKNDRISELDSGTFLRIASCAGGCPKTCPRINVPHHANI